MLKNGKHLRKRLCTRADFRGLDLSEGQVDTLMGYLDLVLQTRSHFNLTGLRDPEHILDVLIIESLDFCRADLIPPEGRILDVGTGAGVPGITLAVWGPGMQLTLLDRTRKKIAFVRSAVTTLGLSNCRPEWGAAEDMARNMSPDEQFDVVVARGVGTVARLMRLARPLLRPHGRLLLRKPPDTREYREAQPLLASPGWAGMRTFQPPGEVTVPWDLAAIKRSASA